ncbi:MAG: ABC transporter substrate-binding protein [Herpetosiphonaceae bacterium]|nr:MAG: ABC transporter substrate-binding protein [Herpetosiphonaceae bacterium]
MKRVLQILTLLMALVLAACGTPSGGGGTAATPTSGTAGGGGGSTTYVVGVVQQTTHPALDAARKGIEDAFKDSGLNVELAAKNANNDQATLTSIIDGFRDQKVDLVIAIGTLPLQATFNGLQGSGIPIVFNTVTDPYQAGAAKSETEHPGVTGIQALPPVTDAFDLILEIQPDAKKVGIIWTSTEKNSEVATGIARKHAEGKGIEFIEATVTKADEVLGAAEKLAGQDVDAIFISTDSTVVSALESVVKVANENQILLVCNDPASARRGCTAALGLDYYDNGYDSTMEFAIPILKGEATADSLPIRKQEKKNIALNLEAAQHQGVSIPDALKSRADQDKIYDKIVPKTN